MVVIVRVFSSTIQKSRPFATQREARSRNSLQVFDADFTSMTSSGAPRKLSFGSMAFQRSCETRCHVSRAEVELRDGAERYFDTDETEMACFGLEQIGQPVLQIIVFGLWACRSDDHPAVELMQNRPPVEGQVLELPHGR